MNTPGLRCSCWKPRQKPGCGVRCSSLAFCALFLTLLKPFAYIASFSNLLVLRRRRAGRRIQGHTTCPAGAQETRLETLWLKVVELNCCQQQREASPKWSRAYRILQGAIPFLLCVLKNRWIWHVYCLKLSCFISASDLGAWQMCQTKKQNSSMPTSMGFKHL